MEISAKAKGSPFEKICTKRKQVDILISKNQALQMLYLKHYVYKTS